MDETVKQQTKDVLEKNAAAIYHLIDSQKNHLCLAQCPAFEEVIDTQLYGLSKQVEFAVEVGVIDKQSGQSIMSELEQSLNEIYTKVYEEFQ